MNHSNLSDGHVGKLLFKLALPAISHKLSMFYIT